MAPQPNSIWTVSSLNFEIKTLLEKGVGTIWLEGEISNFARPASGHWYFSLKDERAQIRAAMFRNRNGRVAFTPQNGQQILVRAQVTLYEARGDFQIIVDHMEEAGTGLLMRRYEELKRQLASEGLFDESRKKPLPAQAKHIGIITSASGAAIRDALSVISRRAPTTEVTLFPCQVQGELAADQIVQAIQRANGYGPCDVLLLIRGGGSLEDLWCFNEERVARAIAASELPVVSGVGHEIDFTIADFVADLRAPTPSVAAERVTLDQYELMARVDQLQARLLSLQSNRLRQLEEQQQQLQKRLSNLHPKRQISALQQRLNYVRRELVMVQKQQLEQRKHRSENALNRLQQQRPELKIAQQQQRLDERLGQLQRAMQKRLEQLTHRFHLQARSLDNLSPLKTLGRGYAAVSHQGKIVSSVKQLKSGDEVDIRLGDGSKKASIV